MMLRYELMVRNFDDDLIFCEDFRSINQAVKIAKCFDTEFVVMTLEDLASGPDRWLPIYEYIEVMRHA